MISDIEAEARRIDELRATTSGLANVYVLGFNRGFHAETGGIEYAGAPEIDGSREGAAHAFGYEDGKYWRERPKQHGIIRLAVFRRVATSRELAATLAVEDRTVRRWIDGSRALSSSIWHALVAELHRLDRDLLAAEVMPMICRGGPCHGYEHMVPKRARSVAIPVAGTPGHMARYTVHNGPHQPALVYDDEGNGGAASIQSPAKTPENGADKSAAEVRRQTIDAYWDDVMDRIAFLDALARMGRSAEALILCSTYIDGVAKALAAPGSKTGLAFCTGLAAHERAPYFSLIHPLQLIRAGQRMGGQWPAISGYLESLFPGPTYSLMQEADFLACVGHTLPPADLALLRQELWRGSLAAVAYDWIRNPAVHALGGANNITLGKTTYLGEPVPSIGLHQLASTLRSMASTARANSHVTGHWP